MNAWPLNKLVPDFVKRFSAYIPSQPDDVLMKRFGCDRLYRLNNNENALGPPKAAQEVVRHFLPTKASIYPSGDAYHLRIKVAERFGCHPDQVLVGNGANEVITFVIKAFCQEGDNIVTADKTFAVYEWVAEFSGFEARLVPLKDFAYDDQGMLARIDERTKVIFVCQPNNPTGTYWPEHKLQKFLEAVDGQQIVVIDEAYGEFVEHNDFAPGLKFVDRFPNVIVFRTFSKMYALAGLRIGYLIGSPEVVDVVRRTCVVYSVNTLAQAAALAAVDDDEHVLKTRELVNRGKAFLAKELTGLGLETVANQGNFVMIKLPFSDTLAYRQLMTKGYMIRSMTGFRFPNWIRVTISHTEIMEGFIEALASILKEFKDRT